MKYSKSIITRPDTTKMTNTSNSNSNSNIPKSMYIFEKIITYLIAYFIIGFIISDLNPKTIKSSEVIKYENSQIFKEIVKRPDTYINIITEYNLKYLLTKNTCMLFINEISPNKKTNTQTNKKTTTQTKTNNKVKKLMVETEILLIGLIDVLKIKLYMDNKMFNYDRLKITQKDIKSYEKLDNIFNEHLDTIYKQMIELDKKCNRKIIKSSRTNTQPLTHLLVKQTTTLKEYDDLEGVEVIE